MQTLAELEKVTQIDVEAHLVDEDYCIDIINKGNVIKGFGLYLAKTHIHKDSQTGWEAFCKKAGIHRTKADASIKFYLAKSDPKGSDLLPNTERVFRELRGETVEDKVEYYQEVKTLVGKETPTAQDVTLTRKIKERVNTSPAKQDEYIRVVSKASPKVKEEFLNTLGVRGVSTAFDLIKEGAEDEQVLEVLRKKPEPKPKRFEEAMEANKKLRTENKALKERVTELELRQKDLNYVAELKWCITSITIVIRDAKNRKLLEGATLRKMKPYIKQALQLLQLPITEVVTLEDLKRAYRDCAKQHHPDLGGDAEMFVAIKNAYEIVKGELNGK